MAERMGRMGRSTDDDWSEPGGAEEAGGRQRAVLLVLAAVQFISIVDFMIVMPLGPQLMRTLAIDPAQFGRIVSSYTLSAGVVGLLASAVVDRFGRRAAFWPSTAASCWAPCCAAWRPAI
jgi:predicted MFS family arabinose efflux permease